MDELDTEARLVDCLPEGYLPLGFTISIKALSPDGDMVLVHRLSRDITHWEGVGMTMSFADDLRGDLREIGQEAE